MVASFFLPDMTPLGGRIAIVVALTAATCYWVFNRYRHHLAPGK
jgi:hypothetical protein